MRKITIRKRQRVVISALAFVASALVLQYFNVNFVYLAVIQLVFVGWVLDFDLKAAEILPFLLPAVIYTYVAALVIETLPHFWDYVAIGAAGIMYYVLLLALNIINVSTVRTVPLQKAALSSLYFLGMVILFFLGTVFINAGWAIDQHLLIYWAAATLFGGSYLYLSSHRYHFLETGLLALVVGQVVTLVNFWPANKYITIIAIVGWIFIFLGILQHHVEKDLKKAILREYFIIGIILFVAFLWI